MRSADRSPVAILRCSGEELPLSSPWVGGDGKSRRVWARHVKLLINMLCVCVCVCVCVCACVDMCA